MTTRRPTRVPATTAGTPTAPTGVWLAASAVHGRDVRTDEPYPHIHTHTGVAGCAACQAPRTAIRRCPGCPYPLDPVLATEGHTRHYGCGGPDDQTRPQLSVIQGGRA
ncbi:MAG TPA: hypothetical protein VFR67_06120 [Pilimelia sp.]|nr:hypothetical protein [Pilimelia sp.]